MMKAAAYRAAAYRAGAVAAAIVVGVHEDSRARGTVTASAVRKKRGPPFASLNCFK